MTIQHAVPIAEVIRNAVTFNPQNWKGVSMSADTLLDAVRDFFALLDTKNIPHVLVGGIALLHYVEGRNTEDLDLIISMGSLERLPEIEIISRDMYFARGAYGALQIDFLLSENPLFKLVQSQHTTTHNFLGPTLTLATVEGLLLLKLYALPSLYRQGGFARVGIYENDIATLLHTHPTDTAKLLKTLARYLSDTDLAEVQQILAEIEARVARFRGETD
jgi:hypothetical protein